MNRAVFALSAVALVGAAAVGPTVSAQANAAHTGATLASVADDPTASEPTVAAEQRGIAGVAKALHAGFKAASAYKAAAQVAGWASILGRSETPSSVDPGLESAYFDR